MDKPKLLAASAILLSGVHLVAHGATPSLAANIDCRITPVSVAGVRVGSTLKDARAALPQARFVRRKGLDGVDVVEARVDGQALWQSVVGVDLPAGKLPDSTVLPSLETFHAACRDDRAVGPGTPLRSAAEKLGGIRELAKSDVEQREFVRFAEGPAGVVFRSDAAGVYESGRNKTLAFHDDARILSVGVESGGR